MSDSARRLVLSNAQLLYEIDDAEIRSDHCERSMPPMCSFEQLVAALESEAALGPADTILLLAETSG